MILAILVTSSVTPPCPVRLFISMEFSMNMFNFFQYMIQKYFFKKKSFIFCSIMVGKAVYKQCVLFTFPFSFHFCSLEYIFFSSVIPLQLLHLNSDYEHYMFQRPSAFFWCSSEDSAPCLDISSITLTPMSSPDSRQSSGLLTPPPSKSGLPKPVHEYSIPRPRVIQLVTNSQFFFQLFYHCFV